MQNIIYVCNIMRYAKNQRISLQSFLEKFHHDKPDQAQIFSELTRNVYIFPCFWHRVVENYIGGQI